jgi:hypothetical protein
MIYSLRLFLWATGIVIFRIFMFFKSLLCYLFVFSLVYFLCIWVAPLHFLMNLRLLIQKKKKNQLREALSQLSMVNCLVNLKAMSCSYIYEPSHHVFLMVSIHFLLAPPLGFNILQFGAICIYWNTSTHINYLSQVSHFVLGDGVVGGEGLVCMEAGHSLI